MLSTSWSCSAALCATSQCADLSTASPTDCPKSSLKFENSPTTKNRHTLAVYAHLSFPTEPETTSAGWGLHVGWIAEIRPELRHQLLELSILSVGRHDE